MASFQRCIIGGFACGLAFSQGPEFRSESRVAIQSAGTSAAVLAKVRKLGAIFQPVITGERGEIAVISFDNQVQWLQDFTSDGDRISSAIGQLQMGAENAAAHRRDQSDHRH